MKLSKLSSAHAVYLHTHKMWIFEIIFKVNLGIPIYFVNEKIMKSVSPGKLIKK